MKDNGVGRVPVVMETAGEWEWMEIKSADTHGDEYNFCHPPAPSVQVYSV